MTAAELSARLLLAIEGKKLAPYRDTRGVWTAGIGHTKGVGPETPVTPELVTRWFADDQAPLLRAVEGRPVLEAAALVSFGFNCGLAALKKVLAGASRLEDYIYAGGAPVLRPRRDLEAALIALSRELAGPAGGRPHGETHG